jgi:hypothetical protein
MGCREKAIDLSAFSPVMVAGPSETCAREVGEEERPLPHPPHAVASWHILDDKDHFGEQAGPS